VSTTPGYEEPLERAAAWAVSRIERIGGTATVLRPAGKPLVVGDVSASKNPAAALRDARGSRHRDRVDRLRHLHGGEHARPQ
jgi:hypothetical protein